MTSPHHHVRRLALLSGLVAVILATTTGCGSSGTDPPPDPIPPPPTPLTDSERGQAIVEYLRAHLPARVGTTIKGFAVRTDTAVVVFDKSVVLPGGPDVPWDYAC